MTTQNNTPVQGSEIQCVQYVIAQILDGTTFDTMRDRIAFKPKSLDRFWHIAFGAQIVADRIAPQTVRDQLNALLAFIDDLLDKTLDEDLEDDNED